MNMCSPGYPSPNSKPNCHCLLLPRWGRGCHRLREFRQRMRGFVSIGGPPPKEKKKKKEKGGFLLVAL